MKKQELLTHCLETGILSALFFMALKYGTYENLPFIVLALVLGFFIRLFSYYISGEKDEK